MDLSSLEDAALLERSLQGDGDAFAMLMRRHEDRIFALCLRMTGNRADALDASQETFITAYRKGSAWRGEASFPTWLYRIAMNASYDLVRRRKGWQVLEADPGQHGPEGAASPDAAGAGQSELADDVATRIDLARALGALPAEYREAVVMHDLGGIPYDEIGRVTGVAIGTVKSRISRGRRQLAGLLEQRPRRSPSKPTT